MNKRGCAGRHCEQKSCHGPHSSISFTTTTNNPLPLVSLKCTQHKQCVALLGVCLCRVLHHEHDDQRLELTGLTPLDTHALLLL